MLGGRSSLRAQITKMNPYQCFIIIEVQIQDLLLFPVFQCTDSHPFSVWLNLSAIPDTLIACSAFSMRSR